ncbi:hypothetical protein CLOACE_16700 [Clostridium acetireducens DSM 10703]|uniref:Uncharacterized protein n=1 Tax=Clostridium acetireducens DSM 10703 TaxID=1121290 RepID=A0A1E8EXL2_9CLOT|nr:methyltransferase domain-containing protein [Clostridium acetireducens]OFI05512.1 hypothetical protein CLOACE_16700 [Clostridium acetireducens DSM 10703]
MEKHKCIICGKKFNKYIYNLESKLVKKYKIIGSNLENYNCPYCKCDDKIRHLVLFFNKLNIWKDFDEGIKLLCINPNEHLKSILKSKNIDYTSANFYKDIKSENIGFKKNYFDFIICNNVFEYIKNEDEIIKHLYNILKRGGKAIIQTSYSKKLKKEYEYKNQQIFFRIYGRDFFKKLRKAGFNLNIFKSKDMFHKKEAYYYGFNNDENLIMVLK